MKRPTAAEPRILRTFHDTGRFPMSTRRSLLKKQNPLVDVSLGMLLSVSIGLASVTAGLESGNKSLSNHLLAKAESALHLAKNRGGNSYTLADP